MKKWQRMMVKSEGGRGFQSFNHLMAYIIIVCNGDHDAMIYKKAKLTWLEEWFFFFEYLWGRTITRW